MNNPIKALLLFCCFTLFSCSSLTGHNFSIQEATQPRSSNYNLGIPLWQFDTGGIIACSPIVESSIIYVQSTESIYAINTLDGKAIWKYNAKSNTPFRKCLSPQVSEKFLVTHGEQGSVIVLNKNTGELFWLINGTPSGAPIEDFIVENNIIHIAWYDSIFAAYDILDRKALWNQEVPKRSSLFLASYDETIFLEGNSWLNAYHSITGSLAWTQPLDFSVNSMVFEKNNIYIIASGYHSKGVIAIDVENPSNIIWEISSKDIDLKNTACANIGSDGIYISGDTLIKISKDNGEIIWETKNIPFQGCPVEIKKYVIVQVGQEVYQILDRKTGTYIDHIESKSSSLDKPEFTRNPILDGEVFIVPFGESQLFGYNIGNFEDTFPLINDGK